MSWRHRIAITLLAVFTALPAVGAFCAMTCLSASNVMAEHHGAAKRCEDRASASSGAQVGARSQHDCRNHEAAVVEIASTPAIRADIAIVTPLVATGDHVLPAATLQPQTFVSSHPYAAIPIAPPSTATPLVLRV